MASMSESAMVFLDLNPFAFYTGSRKITMRFSLAALLLLLSNLFEGVVLLSGDPWLFHVV